MLQKRPNFKSSHYIKKRRKQAIFRACLWFLFIVSLIWGASFWSHNEFFTIKNIKIVGNDVTVKEDIENIIVADTAGNYFGLFSRANIIIYPKSKIKKDILNQFKRISQVDIGMSDRDSIEVDVVERKPIALWCTSGQDITEVNLLSDECYFLDETGYIFAKAATFTGNVFFKYYGSVDGGPIGVGYFPESKFVNLEAFIKGLENLKIKPIYLSTTPDGDFEAHLAGGSKIIFNDKDISNTLINLDSLLSKNNLIGEEVISSLDYIDLRFGNKLFYKLKE